MVLCLVLAGGGIAGSLLYQGNTAFGKQSPFNIFRSPVFLVPAGLLVVNIFFCAWKRLGSLPFYSPRTWTFAGMHLGVILLATGMILDGAFGFLGTKYYYRGVPDSSYFDWRKNREESFPFRVEVVGTETRFHPLNLQVGVKDSAGNKVGLYAVREGVPFDAGKSGIRVTPRRFDIETKTLLLDAEFDGRKMGGLSSSAGTPASVSGHAVSLVAYANPEPSEYVARVRFHPASGSPVEKEIRVNRPAAFAGTSYCLVEIGADRYGNPYAGLQMTREPGEPVFWAGALLFALSLVARFLARKPPEAGRAAEGGEDGGREGNAAAATVAGLSAALLLSAFPYGAHAFGNVIAGDRTWEGEVRVVEPVTVEKGATLRVRPGTTVLLSGEDSDGDGCRDGYIQVFGKLLVEGERERPVRFVRLDPGKAWEEIFLKDAEAVIRSAVFEGAGWGLHIHEGNVKVENSVFRRNGGGARLRGTGVSFSRCTIERNDVGLRFWNGGPKVGGSAIERNGTGLFFREGMGGGKINGNRIANREWNLKVGDWAAGDLDVSRNFWGGGGEAGLSAIGDFREKRETGRIVLQPVLATSPAPCGADLREGDR
jgi:hypothetical protein